MSSIFISQHGYPVGWLHKDALKSCTSKINFFGAITRKMAPSLFVLFSAHVVIVMCFKF